MAKQLNVNLAFTADTGKAKAQLQSLQKDLDQLLSTAHQQPGLQITKELEQASVVAATLKTQLQEATNVETGKLDLGKLNEGLSRAGLNATKIKDALLTLGPSGAQAFAQFAQSVTLAEVPMRRISARLQEFGTTLKNTARWQISSSILHGFMGTISSAYNYAQDLNKSLNDIRIVTGSSVEEMASFAVQANKAAKALSTTTTEYTNASLIFYQQGLSESEVQKRTDITIKMANAAGVSAETASDQLTAVWNNFYDGSKSLEYYADVMTALGAATASSTDEIAGGLEKFAAIGETIGLSYEYAASALATITSNTRQSEEVVGTALKTIFARIQGLNLGETLDDGTTLNKYSEALQKVGISIYEQTGEIKTMDTLLDEMASKWGTLAEDQQIALAQTVAGVRQYTQLVALMENWDNGDNDSMQANLATSYGAEGTLQEQADIYAESWEAASDRVRASAEAIYGALLNDKFFISLNQGFAGFLDIINGVIDGMGGLKGVLLGLGAIFLKVYQGQIANSINNLIYSLKMLGDAGRNEIAKLRTDTNKELQTLFSDSATPTGELIGKAYAAQSSAQKDYLAAAQNMSAEQQKIAQILLDQHNTLVQNAAAQGEIAEKSAESAAMEERKQRTRMQQDINSRADKNFPGKGDKSKAKKASYIEGETKRVSTQLKEYQNLTKQAATFKEVVSKAFGTASTDMTKLGKEISTLQDKTAQLTKLFPDSASRIEAFGVQGAAALDKFEQAMKEAGDNPELVDQAITELIATIEKLDAAAGSAEGKVSRIVTKDGTNAIAQSGTEYGKLITQMLGLGSATDGFAAKLQKIPSNVNASVTSLVAFGQKLSSIAMAISSVKSLIETWNDTDLTFGEKMLQTLTTLGMVIPILTTAISKDTIAKILNTVAEKANAAAKGGSTAATWAQTAANWALNASLGPVLLIILAITAAIAILIAIGAGITKMWQNWKASTPEGQLKALKEEAEELSSRLEDTKQKAEDLKSAFDNYDSVVEKLAECKRGTEEWRDALGDVNDSVLQMLEDYPELATYVDSEGKSGVYRDEETGALTINENWRDEKQTEIDDQILGQTAALQQNQVRQHKINENIAMNDAYGLLWSTTGKEFGKYDYETGEVDYSRMKEFTDAYTSGDTDAMKDMLGQLDFESLENELQIRMDMAADGIDYDSLDAESKRAALIGKLEEYGWAEEGQGEEYLQMRLDNLYSNFEYSLTNSGLDEALRNYATAIDTTTAAQDAYNDSMAQTLLADNERVQNSKYADTIIDLSGDKYGELVDSNYEKRLSEITDRTGMFGDVGTDVSKAAMDEYAKLMGLTDDENFKVTNYKANGKVVYDYTGEDGKKASKEVDAETIASALAAADANKQLASSAEALVSTFSKLNEKQAAAVTAATSGDTSKLSLNQIQNGVDASTLGLDETDLANLGYETIDALQADLDAAIADALEGWNKTISTYSSGAQTQMNAIAQSSNEAINSISQATLLSYGDMIQSVQQMGGQAAAENMGSALTTLMEENAGKAEEIMQAASGIDWSQGASALNELKGKLFDIGIHIDENSAAWQAFQSTVNGLNTSVVDRDLDSVRTQISEIAKIAKDVEMGDVISDEDYKTLVAYNGALKEMFALTADGYMYVGQGSLGTIAVDAAAAQLEQTKADNEKAIAAQKAIDSLGWRNTTTNEFTDEDWYGLANGTDSNSRMASMAQYMSENKGDAVEALGWDSSYLSELATIVGDTTGTYTSDQIEAAKSQLQEFYGEILQLNTNYEQGLYDNVAAEEVFASTLQSLDDLEQAYADGTISLETYGKMQEAVFKNEAEAEGFDYEELSNYADELMETLDENGKKLVETREEANKLALAHAKMERGIDNLADNWDNWNKSMKNGSLKEQTKTMNEMKKAMSDIIGVDIDQISDDFITNAETMELMEKAAQGDMEALDALGPLFAKNYIAKVDINRDNFEGNLEGLRNELTSLMDQFQMEDIEIGTSLDQSGYATAMTELMAAAGTDIDTINSILAGMGFEPEVTYLEIPAETYSNMVQTGTTSYTDPLTGQTYTAVLSSDLSSNGGDTVRVPVINGSKTTFKGGGSSAASSGAKGGGGGGGGGGGKPKKADTVKKSDIVERYKEIDDALDDIGDKMEDASKAADRLWGPARLKAMKDVNDALKEEIEGLKKKRQEAAKYDKNGNLVGGYLKEDKDALKDTIKTEAGVNITDADFDDKGNFTKYDEVLNPLFEELDAAIKAANADGNADEDEQEKIDKIQERIDKVKEAISQYDETKELVEDLDNDIQDKIYEWQDNNYEQLNYKLELELEINESELELVEYYMGKAEGDIYKTAEAFGYLNQQAGLYEDNLKAQEAHVNELHRAYQAGEISMADYKEGLREAQSAMIENLESLQEQKEAMQDYYGNVMDMALEEIHLYTDEMEELNSVLDHYSSILELVGKQEDYATKGKVLQSKASNLRNEMQVQQELYEKSNAEAEKWAAKMATAVEGSNEYETYKKNWIAAQEAANEAQDNMLSKTEEWAEAMKAVVENELAGLAKTMEESLTGGTSFDELLTSMERRSSLQEEYLTTTNQIYETNKLMRQAQQEIDKTTNSVAKRKLANFINETEQMQEQGKLSQYELDIQQAKYDLLLAEIALEEAQSAKSTVRLQRDSEGNFGYVYTADQGAVGEAEQELADKQNALYNLGLEGANDYSQKYAETMQEAQDAITELTQMWMNGEIESEEEYQRRKAEIQDYYYEKLKQYSELYQVALTTDSNVIKDAWSTDFGDMMYKTEDWKVAVDDYFAGAAESMQTWAEVCGTVLDESGLDDVSKKVEEINTKSENLKNTLIGEDGESGVVGAMMSEVEAAGKLSEAYIGIQNQIDEVIRKYEEMMGVIHEDYTDESTPEVDPAIDPEPEPEEPAPDPEPPESPAAEGPTYQTGTLTWTGNGASRIWKDSTGKTYKYGSPEQKAIQKAFDRAYGANGGYKGDYWGGWNKLNADVLHKKYGLATGGYTGDWDGSYGKLAFLHQKELVLNANDTENFLQAMDILDKIVSAIDLYSMNSQLGGALSSPSLGNMGGGEVLEQQVHIEASFPGVQDRNEIEEAFNTLINRASQYANRK